MFSVKGGGACGREWLNKVGLTESKRKNEEGLGDFPYLYKSACMNFSIR